MRYKFLLSLCLLVLMASCTLPSTEVTIGCDVTELIDAIDDANASPTTTNTINLAPSCSYVLTVVNNSDTNGNNGLPAIISPIVINGYYATIQRSSASGIPAFRFFSIESAGNLTLYDTTLSNGLAGPGTFVHGGAIYNWGSLTINNSAFSDNQASNGGAIYTAGSAAISASVFTGNNGEAGTGGAISNPGSATIDATSFSANQSPSGGAITNWDSMTISRSSFSGNQVTTSGGAIRNEFSGTLSVETSTFSGNLARIGAGILNEGQLDIVNSTFSGNSATCLSMPVVCGTTILNYGSTAAVEINYSTIANNGGPSPSAAIVTKSGSVLLRGAIVADNSDADCGSYDGGSISASDANLDSDGSCTGFSITASPMLGPLANNGGSTLTHALLPSSPAIDASPSSCPATDQRGVSRPQGSLCDLGAYEFEGPVVGPIQVATLFIAPVIITPFPLYTPTPTPFLEPFGNIPELTLCWVGPGDPYDVVSSLQPGTQVELLGTGQGGGFLVVQNPRYNLPCWVREADVDTGGFDLSSLRVIKIPPLPTKTPTPTPVLGCMVDQGLAAGPKCVVPCPDPKKYTKTCTP